MKYVSATEAKNKFGVILNDAQQEPIMVKRQNTEVAVILSAKTYEKMRRTNIDRFNAVCDEIREEAKTNGITKEIAEELLKDI